MLTKTKQKLAKQLGKLLAGSVLDDETKNLILKNIDKIPDYSVYKLLDVLESEKKDFDLASFDLGLFLQDQNKNWSKTTEEQKEWAAMIKKKWELKLSN